MVITSLLTRSRPVIVFLAVLGAVVVLLPSRQGVWVMDDGFSYVAVARNLLKDAGFMDSFGIPMVLWPPLFPALLAAGGVILRMDPLVAAYLLNALFFAGIVYLGGLLSFRYLSSSPLVALAGTLTILFSAPLYEDATQAWSDPLFIFLVLFSFILMQSYLSRRNTAELLLLSSATALACLDRYIGVTLVIWGAVIVIVANLRQLRVAVAHLFSFALISLAPVGLWLIRNLLVAGTLTGRGGIPESLPNNLRDVYHGILLWYIPATLQFGLVLILIGVVAGFFLGASFRNLEPGLRANARQPNPAVLFAAASVLFVAIYIAFVVVVATRSHTALESRTLSPLYVPMTLTFLMAVRAVATSCLKRIPDTTVDCLLAIGIVVWLAYPLRANVRTGIYLAQRAQEYNTLAAESETIRYLVEHRDLDSGRMIYSNDPEATFILAQLRTEELPMQTDAATVAGRRGVWPQQDNALLVWFNSPTPSSYLDPYLTLDELQASARLQRIVQLQDGAVYLATRE